MGRSQPHAYHPLCFLPQCDQQKTPAQVDCKALLLSPTPCTQIHTCTYTFLSTETPPIHIVKLQAMEEHLVSTLECLLTHAFFVSGTL